MPQHVGILGGSFDPIHYGHLALAHEVAWALGLAQVLLIPVGQQPFKRGGHSATAQQRLAMVQLACADDPLLHASALEVGRPGPSYTVDTLRALRERFDAATELYFILGADALHELPHWKDAAAVLSLCRIAAVGRPGSSIDLPRLEQALPGLGARLVQLAGPQLDISGTELRRRLECGQPVRYQLPDAVLAYIQEQGLYRT
jgi:nicotinate-nucleotide adenylyltransferase